jgi:hypothetical protein
VLSYNSVTIRLIQRNKHTNFHAPCLEVLTVCSCSLKKRDWSVPVHVRNTRQKERVKKYKERCNLRVSLIGKVMYRKLWHHGKLKCSEPLKTIVCAVFWLRGTKDGGKKKENIKGETVW